MSFRARIEVIRLNAPFVLAAKMETWCNIISSFIRAFRSVYYSDFIINGRKEIGEKWMDAAGAIPGRSWRQNFTNLFQKSYWLFSSRQYNINHNTKERMARIGISIVQKVSESWRLVQVSTKQDTSSPGSFGSEPSNFRRRLRYRHDKQWSGQGIYWSMAQRAGGWCKPVHSSIDYHLWAPWLNVVNRGVCPRYGYKHRV